jgi:hypothetical protein
MSDENHRWQERLKRIAKSGDMSELGKSNLLRSKPKPKKND